MSIVFSLSFHQQCCSIFDFFFFFSVNTLDAIDSSAKADRISPVVIANGRTIRLAVIGNHKCGRPFANSSSLLLRWELSGCEGLAKWAAVDTLDWERFLVLENSSGLVMAKHLVFEFLLLIPPQNSQI